MDPITIVTEGELYDTHFAGLPFSLNTYPTMNLIYLILLSGWIGMLLLTAYTIRKNQGSVFPFLDGDTCIIMTVWVIVGILTAYVIRILHGP
jgi:hypothetical protein